MPIIPHLLSLPKGFVSPFPHERWCALCHEPGAHRHGTYPRYLPGSCLGHEPGWVLVPRFLCLNCSRTFSLLPAFLLRRIEQPAPSLIWLACTKRPWDDLLDRLGVSRNTLWRWKRLGLGLLAKIQEIIAAIPDLSWATLSLHLSRWQYPAGLRKPRPTIP